MTFYGKRAFNRLKVILVEENKTNKWLAKQLNRNETTVSRWCTNEMQPPIESFYEIAEVLNIDVRDLLVPSKINKKNF
ncbi:helix-turn-helix domain-containing protein [Niabella sp. W65]|nr:helix-turn-helix domain-containing protein [Niabella sp. W65]MCH7364874.1 helix-turn-helix domain-containing protein [Niabella sp. W65]ULT40707.1 helix-turn-helix domain-containing protein [Niabella sp. I65]